MFAGSFPNSTCSNVKSYFIRLQFCCLTLHPLTVLILARFLCLSKLRVTFLHSYRNETPFLTTHKMLYTKSTTTRSCYW